MLQLSQLSPETQAKLAGIAGRNSTNIQAAILEAYEEGLLQGALNVAKRFAQQIATTAPTSNNTGDDEDDDGPGTVTASDAAWLRSNGVDPTKKFRIRNSVFTITGVKRSRWKYPISAETDRGARYKFTIAQIKGHQSR